MLGGVVSLVGGLFLVANKKRAKKLANYATPFAAGALISAAFVDLLSEAASEGDIDTALMFTMVGIMVFFVLERFLHYFHHHDEHEGEQQQSGVSMIVTSDLVHNFIDGIAIAAGFLVDPTTGATVTLAVAAHEIPQEIGDFGLMLNKGMDRKKVILINVFSALVTTLSAVLFYQFGGQATVPLDVVLGLVAGFFIYIAVSDIIPSIHKKEQDILAGPQTLMLILGIVLVTLLTNTLHNSIEVDDHNANTVHAEH